MQRYLPFWLCLRLFLHALFLNGQDIHFSQFYEFPLLRNPALAGIFSGNFRFTGAYRNQWQSVTVPYRTMAVSGECKMLRGFSNGDFITTGIQATNDVAGDSKLQRTQVFPVLNYHKLLNEDKTTFLSLAFMGGPVSEHFDATKLRFDDQYVNGAYSMSNATRQQFSNTGFSYWDASLGVSFKTRLTDNISMYIGGGLFHLAEPKIAFTESYDVRLNRKYGVNAGLSAWMNKMDKIVFYADCFMQGGNRLIQGGGLYTHSFDESGEEGTLSVAVGGALRWKDAFIPIIKMYTHQIGIGLSYDVNISKLTTASQFRGGFELSLSYIGLWQRLAESLVTPVISKDYLALINTDSFQVKHFWPDTTNSLKLSPLLVNGNYYGFHVRKIRVQGGIMNIYPYYQRSLLLSGQATVLALQAIVAYSKLVGRMSENPQVTFMMNDTEAKTDSTLTAIVQEGKNVFDVQYNQPGNSIPYNLEVSYNTFTPPNGDKAELTLSTQLAASKTKVGETMRMDIAVTNNKPMLQPMAVAKIGIPAGLSVQPWQLKEIKEKNQVAYYEFFDNYLVLYWMGFAPNETKTIKLDLKADIAGTYKGKASNTCLYYTPEYKHWNDGVEVEIQ